MKEVHRTGLLGSGPIPGITSNLTFGGFLYKFRGLGLMDTYTGVDL